MNPNPEVTRAELLLFARDRYGEIEVVEFSEDLGDARRNGVAYVSEKGFRIFESYQSLEDRVEEENLKALGYPLCPTCGFVNKSPHKGDVCDNCAYGEGDE